MCAPHSTELSRHHVKRIQTPVTTAKPLKTGKKSSPPERGKIHFPPLEPVSPPPHGRNPSIQRGEIFLPPSIHPTGQNVGPPLQKRNKTKYKIEVLIYLIGFFLVYDIPVSETRCAPLGTKLRKGMPRHSESFIYRPSSGVGLSGFSAYFFKTISLHRSTGCYDGNTC